jgi:hypothetical protein
MANVPVPGIRKYWRQKLASLIFEAHAITDKYPEAVAVVQEIHKVLSDIELLAGCTPAKVGESSEWTSVVSSVEENRANICKAVDGKRLCSALYGMYTVTLNELKAVLNVSAQAGQSGEENKTSMASMAQDDYFWEV